MRLKQQQSSHFPSGAASDFVHSEHQIFILSPMSLPITSLSKPAKVKTKELKTKNKHGVQASQEDLVPPPKLPLL